MSDFFDPREQELMVLKAWSHSRLTVFEQCKFRAKLQFLDRIPEPPRPLKPGQTEHANERGERIHNAAEFYVKGGVELIPELGKFKAEMGKLRELYKLGLVSLEKEWAFDREWSPVAWMSSTAWVRIKPDATVQATPKHAIVIDYKTGKRFGNEIKHSEQMNLYIVGMFLRNPELETARVELWYLDLDELHGMNFTRAQALRFMSGFTSRGEKMTTTEDFPPSPNKFNCKWCPYKPTENGGTGHCSVGV
jgi:hypothetical protein